MIAEIFQKMSKMNVIKF